MQPKEQVSIDQIWARARISVRWIASSCLFLEEVLKEEGEGMSLPERERQGK